uniref:Retrovirus-related Pol polyprotein from transposon TNT 1-94 n=1 Tax=Tanacetum cinerariifolium TaxID=118510 RepID=A0A6L2NW18_TANCI|nr:hypothetical protein [Tanacetum cinerariifolium]
MSQPKRPRNAVWFKEKAMLIEAQEAGQILNEEQLAFLADPGILDAILMANLSSYGYDVLSDIPYSEIYHNDMDNQSQSAQTVHMLTKPQVFYDDTHKQALGYQNPFYLKKAQQIKPTLYDGNVISKQHVASPVFDDDETLIFEEVSQTKMLAKQNGLISKEKKVNITLINYAELNRLSEDFGKRFVPQQELSDEQAFWLQTSHHNTDQSSLSHVKTEAPRELPKVSLINTSLKKLKYYLGQFNTVVKKWITPDALTEGEWRFEHTKAAILKEIIPFLKTLKDIFNVFDKDLLNEESLVYVRDTCPNAIKLSEKKVSITPMNKVKKVRFSEPLTSSSNIKQVESSKTSDSNTPVLSSIGLKCSTSTYRSQPTGTKKNDRILQKPSSNRKNKVEAQPRKVNKKESC